LTCARDAIKIVFKLIGNPETVPSPGAVFFFGEFMEKNFAYSILNVKAVDEKTRTISGMATTPEVDRQGDIVDPKGAEFAKEIPLLWQHDALQPVGTVRLGKATKDGIPFTATIASVDTPAGLVARLDEAWQSVKSGLVRAVSIGFRALEFSFMEDTGGLKFSRIEIMELSLVTIPANAGATIAAVKSADFIQRAASGATPSGLSEKKVKPIISKPKEGKTMIKSLTDQLKAFREELNTIDGELDGIVEKSAESGETPDAATEEHEEELKGKRAAVLKHISRIQEAQERASKKAEPVTEKAGTDSRVAADTRSREVVVRPAEKLEKGIEFARYAMCQAAAKGNPDMALRLAKTHYGHCERVVRALQFQQERGQSFENVMKAAVNAGTTLDATWAGPLVDYQNFAGDFVEFLRPQTIIGQFGQGVIPSLNRIPFNVRIAGQTSGGNAYWVGEGAPKPLTHFDFTATELRWYKVATIAVITDELIRFSDPSAERLVRDALAAAVIERMDIDFINPAKAAVANVSPAAITNGATNFASGGSDADSIRCDLKTLWQPFINANNAPRTAVYIMNSATALSLSLMVNPLGQPEFPGITMNGGTLAGIPVIVSDYIPTNSAGEGIVVLVNARDIWLADDGQVNIDASREASLQMLDNPTNNSATGTPTTMVSMFQTNSMAIKAERFINWARRRSSGVAYLTGVNWGSCVS
jgi:HK97 family phage major capsid protein/HK97 family phage prohead protease